MIAASAMPALPSVPSAGEAPPSAMPPDAAQSNGQPAEAGAAAARTKSASHADGKPHAANGRQDNAFDRLLAPDAAAPAATTATPQATAGHQEKAAAVAEDATPATPAASLAEQLLGLLGALPGAAPQTTDAAPAGAAVPGAPTAAATSAKPQANGTALAALPIALPSTPVAAPAPGKAESGPFAALLSNLAVERAPADAPAPAATDAVAMASRDAMPLAAPAPTPTVADKLPAVPQPALVQPADPRSGYGDELGSSVVWMAEHRLGHAQLQVSPDHLGPIEVRLQIDGARVHAEFYSAQSDVRHALESSLPRLREMLGQQGLQLGQADVGQRQRNDTPRAPMGEHGTGDCFPDAARPLPGVLRRARGLVDEYA